jgi:SecD/SecF fusion protein
LAIESVRSQFPGNVRIAFGIPETNEQGVKSDIVAVYAIKTMEGSDKAKLEGDGVQQASQDFDDRGRPAIKMLMTKQGERTWGEMTTNNVGKPIAIVLDNIVYSAPTVIRSRLEILRSVATSPSKRHKILPTSFNPVNFQLLHGSYRNK